MTRRRSYRSRQSRTTREVFDLFIERAERLLTSSPISDADKWGLDVSYHRQTGWTFASKGPSPEGLELLAGRARLFIMSSEPTHLGSIHGLAHRTIRSDELRGHLTEARAGWRDFLRRPPISLQVDDRRYPPELVMDLIINGWYFHSDREKLEELQSLGPVATVLTRHIFVDAIAETMHQVAYVAHILKVALAHDLVD